MDRRGWESRAAALLALWAFGCAEPVGDVDRTQGNLLAKADLAGEWYLLETIVDVPPTAGFTFIGETGKMERVRWEIQKDVLVAYRSYPLVPGADAPATGKPRDAKDNPVAAYPILEHVDVQREYDPTTGEQSNVISENASDRLWWERDFVRVDWSRSLVANFDFIAPTQDVTSVAYFVEQEQGGPEALYREDAADGSMRYFDVLGKLFVQPDEEACYLTWWGLGAYDCTSAEIVVRTSFSKVPERTTYEPFHYDDQLLSRFGYFRSERFTYDPQRGVVDSARRYMIQRHHIWQESVKADGTVIPVPQREVRTVPYYLSETFPDDDLLREAAKTTMAQWDRAARRGVEAATGKTLPESTHVFVLCGNPVAEGDDPACGERGFAPRMGDLRYSTLHWVDPNTVEGLLGYGPSAADPITGEILAGKAYVYGAAVDQWATDAVDVIRYFNDDLDEDLLIHGKHFQDAVRERAAAAASPRAKPDRALERAPLHRPLRPRERAVRPAVRARDLRPYDPGRIENRLEAARRAGASPMLLNTEVKRALSTRAGQPWESLDPETRDRFDPTRMLSPTAMKRIDALRRRARARTADGRDMIEPSIEGVVRKYAGRTDYDQLWREIRAEIFASTAEHEVGHTLGLRHNFAGSYDSLNFPDEYWHLREENLHAEDGEIDAIAEVYALSELTDAQREGGMRQKQYSSIMDYGYNWFNDLNGLGKYDEAALIFGYTAGSYEARGERCERYPSAAAGDGCLAELPGLVEVFEKGKGELGRAGDLLTREEDGFTYDDSGLPSINILERFHYTSVARAFPALEDLTSGRRLVGYADYLDGRAAEDRAVRVPYMFCSDEWEGGLLSCNAFDQGADPFEMTRTKIDNYRAYYWFENFKRDRVDFDVWYPLFDYTYRVFLPLSDYFQFWYLAPYGHDDLFDRTYEMSINAGFNLFSEVLSTPGYGTYCQGVDGKLVHLSDDVLTQGQVADDESRCEEGTERVEVAPGDGRRQFSFYDAGAGYYFEFKPLEAGHYWTTLAAIWALFDPEARIVGLEGDAGVFSISYYDWFADEIDQLMTSLLTKDYGTFAPRAFLSPGQGTRKASLFYTPVAPLYTEEGTFDPETGASASTAAWTGGSVGLCEPCEKSEECTGYTGRFGGTYCQPVGDATVCLLDCSNGPDACPEGTECDDNYNCAPIEEDGCGAIAGQCSAAKPYGSCPEGRTCTEGKCLEPPALVEAEPTFMLATDILWYGMLFTTSSYSTRFNDQMNVFRVGNDNQVEVDDRFSERHQFTDPLRGTTYAAVQPRCDGEAALGGSTGLCGECEAHADCAGVTGLLGGVFCVQLEEDGPGYCLQDCTEDRRLCADGETCVEGNCVPAGGACGEPAACDDKNPHGGCPDGETCADGQCVPQASARCRLLGDRDSAAVRLVDRGAQLAREYEDAFTAYYEYDGPDEALNDTLARAYYRAQFELTNHLDLLETVIATYGLFGRVY